MLNILATGKADRLRLLFLVVVAFVGLQPSLQAQVDRGTDAACRSRYARACDRNFDHGFSGGGPLWKNHTFFYTAYEKYWQDDWRTSPTGATAPTPQMLAGDFSQLLAFGASTNGCATAPCQISYTDSKTKQQVNAVDPAGNPIYYGSIFLPNGTVALGNVIPSGMISPPARRCRG